MRSLLVNRPRVALYWRSRLKNRNGDASIFSVTRACGRWHGRQDILAGAGGREESGAARRLTAGSAAGRGLGRACRRPLVRVLARASDGPQRVGQAHAAGGAGGPLLFAQRPAAGEAQLDQLLLLAGLRLVQDFVPVARPLDGPLRQQRPQFLVAVR